MREEQHLEVSAAGMLSILLSREASPHYDFGWELLTACGVWRVPRLLCSVDSVDRPFAGFCKVGIIVRICMRRSTSG